MATALDIIEVIMEASIFSSQLLNVFHFRPTDNVDDEDMKLDLAELLDTEWMTVLAPILVNDIVISTLYFKNVTTGADLGSVSWTGTQPSSTQEVLPLGVSGLITWPTSQPKVRGRKFIWPFGEASCEDSLWNSATTTILASAAAPFTEAFTGPTSATTYQNGVVNKDGAFRIFIEALISNIPSYQRRRKQGVGA